MDAQKMPEVIIYTDGACSGNPGPGGWAAILMFGEHKKSISGAEKDTTNNRMEVTAAIEGLKALKRPCKVDMYTDSAYLCNAFREHWINAWQRDNWMRGPKKNQPVANRELWQELVGLTRVHSVTWHKVKGHSSNEWNNECDRMAVAAIENLKKQ